MTWDRKVYVFLTQRPIDKQEWPVVYGGDIGHQTKPTHQMAEECPHRTTPVVVVDFDAPVATPEERSRLVEVVASMRRDHEAYDRLAEHGDVRSHLSDANHVQRGALLDLIEGLLDGRVKL